MWPPSVADEQEGDEKVGPQEYFIGDEEDDVEGSGLVWAGPGELDNDEAKAGAVGLVASAEVVWLEDFDGNEARGNDENEDEFKQVPAVVVGHFGCRVAALAELSMGTARPPGGEADHDLEDDCDKFQLAAAAMSSPVAQVRPTVGTGRADWKRQVADVGLSVAQVRPTRGTGRETKGDDESVLRRVHGARLRRRHHRLHRRVADELCEEPPREQFWTSQVTWPSTSS